MGVGQRVDFHRNVMPIPVFCFIEMLTKIPRMYHGSGSVCALQQFCLHEVTSRRPSEIYDIKSKIRLRQSSFSHYKFDSTAYLLCFSCFYCSLTPISFYVTLVRQWVINPDATQPCASRAAIIRLLPGFRSDTD